MEKYEPIHDVSVRVSGPDTSSDSFDCKYGSAGDNQPIAQPWHNVITFAVNEEIENYAKTF